MIDLIRLAVRSHYDAQKLRIEMGNRICAQIRSAFIGPQVHEDCEGFKEYETARKEFNTAVKEAVPDATSELARLIAFIEAHDPQHPGVITHEWAVKLQLRQGSLATTEKELLSDVKGLVKEVDIWPWLESVKGCGPAMSGVIVCEMKDPARFANVAKLWAYSGLHVIDGRAARREKGKKANWNSFLKTKLVGVLGPSFLKCGSPYREFYDNYKTRLENRPCSLPPEKHKAGATAESLGPNGCTKGHMHNKAMRYMVKMFVADLWEEWRKLRGLPGRPSYAEEYLGKVHSG